MKQKYLAVVLFCGNFCVLFYDTVICQHYTAALGNECNMSLIFYYGSSVVFCWTQMNVYSQTQNFNTCHTVLHVLAQGTIIP